MKTQLIIRGKLPTLNEYTKANRTSPIVGNNMKRKAEKLIALYIAEQIPNVHYKSPVYITYNWVCDNKRKDKDNVAFAKKFIQDALVSAGVIPNDGWNNIIGWTESFCVDKSNPRVEVSIDYVDEHLPF